MDDAEIQQALLNLKQAGLVTDPAELFRGWLELTGRIPSKGQA